MPTRVCLIKAMVFPVVMFGCESWTIKKAECWRIYAFELWCVEKTLESPLESKQIQLVHPKGNQSWIFIGRTDTKAETPILWPPDAKDSFEKTLMLGKIEGRRRRGQQRIRLLDGITDSMDISLSGSRSWWWTRKPGVLQSTGLQRTGHNWVTELTELNIKPSLTQVYTKTGFLDLVNGCFMSSNVQITAGDFLW